MKRYVGIHTMIVLRVISKIQMICHHWTFIYIPIRDKIETEILQYFINIKRNSHCCIIKQLVHHHIILRKDTSLHKKVQNLYLIGKESTSRP